MKLLIDLRASGEVKRTSPWATRSQRLTALGVNAGDRKDGTLWRRGG